MVEPRGDRLIEARAAFVSDFHLGAAACNATAILDFLARLRCEKLYLIGDIIDGYVANREGKWTQEHSNVLRAILTQTRHGTQVYYLPGNHDSFLRRVTGIELGNILIQDQIIHETVGGQRVMVIHGDQFDSSVNKSTVLPLLGTLIHEKVTVWQRTANEKRNLSNRPPHDLPRRLKKMVKRITQKMASYEETLTEFAAEKGCSAVVCGHIHAPALKLADNGVYYINTGDWTDHCTFVLEDDAGNLRIMQYSDTLNGANPPAVTTP